MPSPLVWRGWLRHGLPLVLCLALASGVARTPGIGPRTLHLLWTTTFVALLALPALSLLGPSWSVPILPSPRRVWAPPPRDDGGRNPCRKQSAGHARAGGLIRIPATDG